MRIRSFWAPTSRIVVIGLAVTVMTASFWMLRQPSAPVVKAQTGLGGPISNLTPLETTMFNQGFTPFNKFWDPRQGIGPVFTQKNCTACHASPVAGGGSPGNTKKDTLFGTTSSDGSFNALPNEGGILLQNRSVSSFIPQCTLPGEAIPTDATLIDKRLAPQAYGMGLIDSIPITAIQANAVNKGMGIQGVANIVPDQNGNPTVGKFGYKAEAATLVQFIGMALTGELGITNPISPDEQLPQGQPIPPNCQVAPEPNDNGSQMIAIFHYLVYLAPNPPASNPNQNGQALFSSVGCALCHLTPDMGYTTGPKISVPVQWNGSSIFSKALSNQPVPLYSDLLLHDMGPTVGDGFPMGLATGNMFRTTPLWGLSTRTFYLHDGRTNSLDKAIRFHGGEATQVTNAYKALSSSDQADLQAFINSL